MRIAHELVTAIYNNKCKCRPRPSPGDRTVSPSDMTIQGGPWPCLGDQTKSQSLTNKQYEEWQVQRFGPWFRPSDWTGNQSFTNEYRYTDRSTSRPYTTDEECDNHAEHGPANEEWRIQSMTIYNEEWLIYECPGINDEQLFKVSNDWAQISL